MTEIFDTAIIGASQEGAWAARALAKAGQSVLLVSSNFNPMRLRSLPCSLKTCTGTVILLAFRHGLFYLSTQTEDNVITFYSKKVVFATGLTPITDTFKNSESVTYDIKTLCGRRDKQAAVVYGDTEEAVLTTLALSKKFKYCYLCTSDFHLNAPADLIKQFEAADNIVHLPNCRVTGCAIEANNKMSTVYLDTYSEIHAGALVAALGHRPNVPDFAKQYISTTADGYAIVDHELKSLLVPGIYAIGTVCNRCGQTAVKQLTEAILNN